MSVPARIVATVLVVALAGVGGAYWWVTREVPVDVPVGETRVLTVDPTIALPVLLEIPTDANGCPGYTVPAPAEPMFEPVIGEGGTRSDFTVRLGATTAILSVCNGPVSENGTADEAVEYVVSGKVPEEYDDLGVDVERQVVGGVDQVISARGDGPALTTRFGQMLVTDFYVEHDGYLHIVGYLRPESVGDTYLPTVEAMLASWSWD